MSDSCTVPVVALLAGKALEVVDIALGSHHHLEGRDDFVTRCAVARRAKQPEGERYFINVVCYKRSV